MPYKDTNKIGNLTESQNCEDLSIGREIFSVGDKVTAKSIPAKSMLLGIPTVLELAKYPSLIGIELTIVEITEDWIVCARPSGNHAPAMTAEDLRLIVSEVPSETRVTRQELVEATPNDV